jgi:tripartite-type tricarboxylate transporter receptor subunit TctC
MDARIRLPAAVVTGVILTLVDAFAQTPSTGPGQAYPIKPIRIVVGLAAGGVADVTARAVGQKISEQLGQPVVVENRTGAGTSLAIERVAMSAPDGYTLLLMGSSATVHSALRRKLPYDLERDLAPISLLTNAPFMIVVHPSMPTRNIKELIALARAQPGKLNYGSNGFGSLSFLAGALFNQMADVKIVDVPYKGGTENVIAAASGQVAFSFTGVPTALPLVSSGKLRSLAVTSPKRVSFLPEMPTVGESGLPGYAMVPWYGLAAPAAVSKDIIVLVNAVIGKAFDTPEMKASLGQKGMEVQVSSPQQYAAFIHSEIEKNAKLIKAAGVTERTLQ